MDMFIYYPINKLFVYIFLCLVSGSGTLRNVY